MSTPTPSDRIAETAESYLAALGAFRPELEDGASCAEVALLAAKVEKASAGVRVLVAARAVACGAHKKAGVADPALWLARAAGTTTAEAKGSLDVRHERRGGDM